MMFLLISMLGLARADSLVVDLDLRSKDALTIRVEDFSSHLPMNWTYTAADGSDVELQLQRKRTSSEELLRLWVEVSVSHQGEIDHKRSFLEIPFGQEQAVHSDDWSVVLVFENPAKLSGESGAIPRTRTVRHRATRRSRSTEP